MNRKAKVDGLILRWAAMYGDASNPRWAAIWVPNPGKVTWNADGVLETGDQYQARFDAQRGRLVPPFVCDRQKDGRYLSLFVDDEVGPWVAAHGLTARRVPGAVQRPAPEGLLSRFASRRPARARRPRGSRRSSSSGRR